MVREWRRVRRLSCERWASTVEGGQAVEGDGGGSGRGEGSCVDGAQHGRCPLTSDQLRVPAASLSSLACPPSPVVTPPSAQGRPTFSSLLL